MTKTETAIRWMEATALDPAHGYDQIYRWGEKGDYDCSAAVITAWRSAGLEVDATYTGNLLSGLKKAGFVDVTSTVDLKNGNGLLRGDVLLTPGKHTAMYCGEGKEVEASINEKGTAKGGQPGDQTGKEFLIRTYRNFPWKYVLRFPEKQSKEELTIAKAQKHSSLYNRYFCVKASALNLRTAPGTGKVITSIKKGTLVRCWGYYSDLNGNEWLLVQVDGLTGYMYKHYLEMC